MVEFGRISHRNQLPIVTSHIFAAASGILQELADTIWRPGDAGESSRRYGFV